MTSARPDDPSLSDHAGFSETRAFFEQVADTLVGLVPEELGVPETRVTSTNLKMWFGPDGREHYEAQYLRDGTFEIGFHAEHRAAERNDAVLGALAAREKQWRRRLGAGAVAGEFVGADGGPWRRISEVGPPPEASDVEAALEVAERLAAYAEALEPIRLRASA